MFKYKIKNYNLTTWLLLIKSYLIISAICGGNSQHTKPGDCSEFYNFTVLNKSRQIFWILQLDYTVLYSPQTVREVKKKQKKNIWMELVHMGEGGFGPSPLFTFFFFFFILM